MERAEAGSYRKLAAELVAENGGETSAGALWKFIHKDYIPTSNRIRQAFGLPEMIVSFRYRDELGQFKGSERI